MFFFVPFFLSCPNVVFCPVCLFFVPNVVFFFVPFVFFLSQHRVNGYSPLSVDGVFRIYLVTGDLRHKLGLFRTTLEICKVTEEENGEVIRSGGSICHYISGCVSNMHLTVSSDSAVYTSLHSTSGKCGDLVDPSVIRKINVQAPAGD